MVFATREEEIDYLRDELERAGYDESSNQRWDEATLGRVRKLKLLEEEAPRRRRADVYDESGSDEEESEDEEEVDEQGICWSGARGPDMDEEEAEAPARRRCAHVKEDGRQCPNFVLGNNEKCDDFDPTRYCGAACAAAAAARAEALAAKVASGDGDLLMAAAGDQVKMPAAAAVVESVDAARVYGILITTDALI